MIIRDHLFSRRSGNPDLSSVLQHQRQKLVAQISLIADLDDLTDTFLTGLVRGSLVRPLTLRLDDLSRKSRTVIFSASDFPSRFSFAPRHGESCSKTVFRICVPFTGDGSLFNYPVNHFNFNAPVGQVSGSEVEFDVVLWGNDDDAEQVAKRIKENLGNLETYVNTVNTQVRAFNESLSPVVTEAFKQKLEKLSGQHAIFDSLGIKEKDKPKTLAVPSYSAPTRTTRRTRPKEQIVTYVQHIYVETIQRMEVEALNQMNTNGGDVHNQIHSS